MIKDKRAINPIVATLLITVIVVVLAVTAWSYYSGFLGIQTRRASEMISIDTVDFVNSKVYVRNTGSVKTNISAIYVDGVSAPITPVELNPGEVQGISATFSVNPGDTARFKVVSTTGVVAEADFTAPVS
ncbi:MAG: archaellin/type IV pilin N-terminal domain-containing protein [Candidatus Bathyarchaeia archaeon]